jgi:hypothetical protein
MQKLARILAVAMLPAISACDIGPIFGPGDFDYSGGTCYMCPAFEVNVDRGVPAILRGDTARVFIWSSFGHDRGTFSVSGSALRVVNGTDLGLATTTPAVDVRVVGWAAGRDTVRARAADTAATAQVGLRVVDSASITGLQTWIEPNAKMRVGDTRHVDVYLYVGQEPVYGGPTSTAVSNTDVLLAEPAQANPRAIFLKAKAVGTATLTIRFLQRSQTYRIDVIP